jgi:hypothetical protein
VPAVLPRDTIVPGESQKRLVNEGGSLQRVIRPFVAQVSGGSLAELVIHERHQLVARAQIPACPCTQKLADRANAVTHATASGFILFTVSAFYASCRAARTFCFSSIQAIWSRDALIGPGIDAFSDGKRFLVVTPPRDVADPPVTIVIQYWDQQLEARLANK